MARPPGAACVQLTRGRGIIATMRIAVFGTGPVGRALAGGLANRGHTVAIGTRVPDDPGVVARLADLPGVLITTHRDAAETAELAIFAIPFDGLSAVAAEITRTLPRGTTLIDATDPEQPGPDGRPVLAIGHDDSGAEMLQRLVPGAHVVKAFNILGADDMVSPRFPEGPPTMLVCGDHQPAVEQAIVLCRELGWTDILNLGGLHLARLTEALSVLWVYSARAAGSWDVAFRLMRRAAASPGQPAASPLPDDASSSAASSSSPSGQGP
jgi:predicted dinucleotide-binding enzyme